MVALETPICNFGWNAPDFNLLGTDGKNYQFDDVLVFVLTKLPSTIYEYIPFSALIGCLYGLGLLAGNSEVTVMRASGVSLLRIVYFVMKPVFFFIIIAVLIG